MAVAMAMAVAVVDEWPIVSSFPMSGVFSSLLDSQLFGRLRGDGNSGS